jgi:hypothetical protein
MSTCAVTYETEVIVNPDRFVSKFNLDAEALRQEILVIRARRCARPHARKCPLICLDCLGGRHTNCDATSCPCVHHQISTTGFVAELLAGRVAI